MTIEFPIITKLGGASKAQKNMKKEGYEISISGMSMWKKRGIPGPAVVCLMKIAEKQKIKVKSADFVFPGKPDPSETGIKRVIATR